jgi:chemotaxis protein histidine kinase CheA
MSDIPERFRDMFVAECRELLQDLNTLLLELEGGSGSDDVIDEIFRAAHSFKGSAGTLEFEDMANLTHEMEAVLDRVRNGSLAVTPPLVTALLECVDALEGSVDAVEADGTEQLDAPHFVRQLLAAVEGDEQPTSDGAAAAASHRACCGSDSGSSRALPTPCEGGVGRRLRCTRPARRDGIARAREAVHGAALAAVGGRAGDVGGAYAARVGGRRG